MLLKRGNPDNNINDVKLLQKALHVFSDGVFGALTEQAVKQYQAANGLKVDGVVGDKTWAKLFAATDEAALQRSTRKITEIVVHCSATPEGVNYTVKDITNWHKNRGFTTIGYHYVIYRDGSVHKGRNINISGAHAVDHNAHSIGICYIGGCTNDGKMKEKDTRTPQQRASLYKLLKELKQLYPNAKILSHRDCKMNNGKYPNKACPSFDATFEYKHL